MATVYANQGWQKTDIYLYANKPYELSASGRWEFSSGQGVGPTGYDRNDGPKGDGVNQLALGGKPNIGQLIGKIGEGGGAFAINGGCVIKCFGTGYLWARMNDNDAGLGDNSGSVELTSKEVTFGSVERLGTSIYAKFQG